LLKKWQSLSNPQRASRTEPHTVATDLDISTSSSSTVELRKQYRVSRSRSILINDLEAMTLEHEHLRAENRQLHAQIELLSIERKKRQQYEEAISNVREKLEELIQENEELVTERISLQRFIMELRQESHSNSSSAWKNIRKRLQAFEPPQQSARQGARNIMKKIQLFESIATQMDEERSRVEQIRRTRSSTNLGRLSAKITKVATADSAVSVPPPSQPRS